MNPPKNSREFIAAVKRAQAKVLRDAAERLRRPPIGGKTPALDQAELAQLGFGIVLYANAALQGAALGMQKSLSHLLAHGRLDEDPAVVVPFKERQRMVNKPFFDALEKKYIP